jgi:hypothetical protein
MNRRGRPQKARAVPEGTAPRPAAKTLRGDDIQGIKQQLRHCQARPYAADAFPGADEHTPLNLCEQVTERFLDTHERREHPSELFVPLACLVFDDFSRPFENTLREADCLLVFVFCNRFEWPREGGGV